MKALLTCGAPAMIPKHSMWGGENSSVGTSYSWGSTRSVNENSEHIILHTDKMSLSPTLQGGSVHQSFQWSSNACRDNFNEQQKNTERQEQDSHKSFTEEGSELSFTSSRIGSSSGELCSYQLRKDIPECTEISPDTKIHAQGETNRSYDHSVVLDLGDTDKTEGISLITGRVATTKKDVFVDDKMHYSTMVLIKRACDPTNVLFAETKEFGQSKSPGPKSLAQKSSSKDPTAEDTLTEELHRSDSNNGSSVLRTCSHCGTAKTPLWRTGPQGPKSLCNACGIRFKKSRKCSDGSQAMELQRPYPAAPISNNLSTGSFKRKQQDTDTSLNICSSLNKGDLLNTTERAQSLQNHPRRIKWQQQALPLKKSWHQQGEGRENPTGSRSADHSCLTRNLLHQSSPSPGTTASMNSPPSPSSKRISVQTQDDKSASPTADKHNHNSARALGREEEEAAASLMALSCGVVGARIESINLDHKHSESGSQARAAA